MPIVFDMKKINSYKADSPYPELGEVEKNTKWTELLKEAYAGKCSELTSVTQYIYHHFNIERGFPEISECLFYISIVEMHHLEIIGGLIKKLGGDPTYSSSVNKNKNWSSKNVAYLKNIEGILSRSIMDEKTSVTVYKDIIKQIENEDIKGLLKRIVLDEIVHIDRLTELYRKYV